MNNLFFFFFFFTRARKMETLVGIDRGWKRRVRNHCYGKWNTEMESFLKGKWREVYIKDERRDCAQCNFRRVYTRFNAGDGILRKLNRRYVSLRRFSRRNMVYRIYMFQVFGKIKKTLSFYWTKRGKNLCALFSFLSRRNVYEWTRIFWAMPISFKYKETKSKSYDWDYRNDEDIFFRIKL